MLYGDYDLRRGDSDAKRTWGGAKRGIAQGQVTGNATTTLSAAAPVADLQRDLATLGFALVKGASTGEFDNLTEWAVLELQCYAKMNVVAKEDPAAKGTYIERLSAVATGADRYAGHVSGCVNAGLRAAMAHWLAEEWRCPVVLDAWSTGKAAKREMENVWIHDEVKHGGFVIKARDFSGYYLDQKATDPLWNVAKSTRFGSSYGPVGDPTLAWPEVEVSHQLVFGNDFDALDSARKSTFRVIRCVSEIECMGFFDIINAYDRAVVSTGLVHWTFLDGSGELSELLAQVATAAPADYAKAFTFFGLDVRATGPAGKVDPVRVKLEDEDGKFRPIVEHPRAATSEEKELKQEELDRLDYVRNWHWCYRFVMAARTIASYRREMWEKVMQRIRTIRRAEVEGVGTVSFVAEDGTTKVRPATIGEVLTSELAMGILLRWHVLSPAGIVASKAKAGKAVNNALKSAKAATASRHWSSTPSAWGQAEEDAFIKALKEEATGGSKEMQESIPKVSAFPGTGLSQWKLDRAKLGALSTKRDSFELAVDGPPGYGYAFADDPLNAGGFGVNDATVQVRPGPVRATILQTKR